MSATPEDQIASYIEERVGKSWGGSSYCRECKVDGTPEYILAWRHHNYCSLAIISWLYEQIVTLKS